MVDYSIAIFFSVVAVCVTLYKLAQLRYEYEERERRDKRSLIDRITTDENPGLN